jgi:hypothetical protein
VYLLNSGVNVYLMNSGVNVYLLNSGVNVYLLNSGVTVYLLNPGIDVAGVVVVGDVPAPVLGPRVEHHDVVFCPTDEEAPRLDDWTGVRPAEHASCHLPTTYFPFSWFKIRKKRKKAHV